MPSIVDNAKQAGFSDDEIGQWATGLRTQAKAAGFNDDEVTAYLGGGIPAPTKVPQPFIDRLMQGTHLSSLWSHLQSGADKADAHSYVAGPGTFLRGAAPGFDTSSPHIFSESFENDLRSAGLIADPDTGRAGPVRFINEAFLRPIGNLFDILGRAASAGVSGAAETIGETVNRLGGPSEKAKAEVQNFANYATAEGMSGGHIAGIGHDITGRPIDLPLGGVPKSEDFTAAAKSIVPDADTPFMQKLRSLYEDKGLHPAEVAHDAQSDVTVTQALASRGTDLPERYQGSTQLETPAKAAERTEPLPAPVVSPEPRPAVDTPQPAPALPSTIPNNIRSFAPSDLTVDADRFQFKSGGDEAGVTDRLQGVSTWDPIKAGLGLVWEDENGQNFIVDGHQRHALAKRIEQADPEQAPRLNAVVVRQADGVSDVEARIIAASKNMAEGTGTAIDAAKIMRDNPDLVKELPPRSELVRQARSLAELGDEPFRMVVNDVVPPNYASIVGRLAPKDDDLQGALLQLLAKTDPANAVQAEAIVRQGIAAGTRRETQATLFGDEQIVSSLYSDRAKVLDRALRELKRDRLVFSTIVRDQDIIQAVGNQLETSANANRAAADAQAAQILQVLANRRGPLSDALSAAARRAADGDSPGAIRSFVAAVRHQAEAGDLVRAADGIKRGRIDAGAENAANLVDPARTEPRRGAEAAATESATDAIKQARAHAPVTEQTAQGEQMVMPGTERSATQAAASREAEGHGMLASERPQEAPGGLFETPKEDEPGLIFGAETGAISWGPPPPKTPLDIARDSILAKISIGERSPKRSLTLSRAYTNVVDQLYPIDEATPTGTPTASNPYRLARLLSGLGAKIDHFLKRGTLDWNTPGQPNGPGLEQVLAPVVNDLQNFRAFAVAAHALEMEAEGITSGMDTGAARTVAREGIKKYGPVLEELVNYQNRVAAYLRDSGVISHDTYDAMTQRWQLYIPANRVLGDGDGAFGHGGGLQPSDPIHRILGSARDWVDPIENVIRNTAIYTTMADKNAVMQSLRDTLAAGGQIGPGSVSPIALIPTAADPALDAALDAWLTAHGVPAPPAGVMNFFRAAGAQPDAKGTISLYDNGVRHTYKVDPEISEAAKGLNRETANIILRIMAPFTAMLRAGAVLSPEFGLRHPFRDFFLASIFNTGGFSPLDMARGFTGFIAKSDEYWHWAASGGGNASMVSLDRRYLQESLEHITQQTGLLTRTINTVFDSNATWLDRVSAIPGLPFKAAQRYVLRPLQVFTELAENASHLGKFIREERATTAATGAPLTREELLEAGWKSRDTAVDAARIGAKMHSLNMISAFANIIVQDTDRWVRGFRDDPVSASLKVMAYITIPQTLLWLYQHDDPRYEEIPAWQRVLSIPVLTDKWEDVGPAGQYGPPAPGTPYRVQGNRMQVNNGAIFRFPQPFSLGVIFGAGPIAALEAFSQHSTKPIGDWLEGFKSIAVPGILPNLGGPILEQFANRSTFTNRTLIPDRLEKQMPEYQYTQYTTETAKALGRLFGAFPGMREQSITPGAMGGGVARALTSPILIENYIRGWTGGLGVYALEIADAALRKEGILPDPPTPASTLADIPFVKAFTIRYPSASAESIQNFQDRYEANRTYYNTWLDKSKQGDGAAATRIAQIGGPRMFVQLDQFKQVISEQSKLIQDVARDPKSSPSDKRQLIDTMYYRTIELARAGNRALDKIDSALPRASH